MRALVTMLLKAHGQTAVYEHQLPNGTRLDVAAIGKSGRVVGIEIKTTVSDLNRDLKWATYRAYCHLFFFALPEGFDLNHVPDGPGIILCSASSAYFVKRNRWTKPRYHHGLWYPGHGTNRPGFKAPAPDAFALAAQLRHQREVRAKYKGTRF